MKWFKNQHWLIQVVIFDVIAASIVVLLYHIS